MFKGDLAPLQEVHETAGGGDQEVATTVQLAHLVRHMRTSVHNTRSDLQKQGSINDKKIHEILCQKMAAIIVQL